MTSLGLGEMFEGDAADTCARKCSLMLMGGRAEGLACADPGARTPIGVSGNYIDFTVIFSNHICCSCINRHHNNSGTVCNSDNLLYY